MALRRPLLLMTVLAALTAPGLPAPALAPRERAPAGGSAQGTTVVALGVVSPPLAARGGRFGGGGFGRRSSGRRSAQPSRRSTRPRRRPSVGHFFGNVLRFLGIAYLFHLLFGLGSGGGSPLGLLIVLAFAAWMVSRAVRRRRERGAGYGPRSGYGRR